MYTTGYSQVSKSSPRAQKKTQYRSKGKSCGYYMRIVFFFSSLIQSLIIVSLVLFLVYGKTQDSASTSRIQDLEESFSRLSIENVALRRQRKNLTNLLNTTLTEKARNDWDLAKLRYFSNISAILIQDMDRKLQQSYNKLILCERTGVPTGLSLTTFQLPNNCGLITERMKAGLALVESNFTQTAQRMRMEMDQTVKERDNINLEVIRLRRDKSTHEKEVEFFKQKCKDDFSQSLSGISNVSKAFLEKINSLFPSHIAFQLTCPKQRDHLEQIRTNCTSLSMEVEDKLQRYLNVVGEQVSGIQAENSRMKAENWRLSDDYRWCSMNRTGLIVQHRKNMDKLQGKHDEEKERLLMDKMTLNGDIEVLNKNVRYKTKANDHLTEKIKQLNMSCMPKTGFGAGGSTVLTQSQLGSAGAGKSSGSANNKPVSTGTGSSSSSIGSGSSIWSANNKPVSSWKSSIGLESSAGSTNKGGSTNSGYSWSGSSNSGQSKTGSGTGRGPSTGNSGGTGSSFDAGRSSGLGGGSSVVAQHLKDLQRIINPPGPEEKQDLSRMLG